MGREGVDWRGAEYWRSKNKGSPRKGTEREREEKEKPREAPLQLLCTGGGSPLLSSLQQHTCSLPGIIRTDAARLHTACINYHLSMGLPCVSTASEKSPFPWQGFIRGGGKKNNQNKYQVVRSRKDVVTFEARMGISNEPATTGALFHAANGLLIFLLEHNTGAPRLH